MGINGAILVVPGMENRVLKGEEADQLILQLLMDAGHPLTTREVQMETQKRLVRCPEGEARLDLVGLGPAGRLVAVLKQLHPALVVYDLDTLHGFTHVLLQRE